MQTAAQGEEGDADAPGSEDQRLSRCRRRTRCTPHVLPGAGHGSSAGRAGGDLLG